MIQALFKNLDEGDDNDFDSGRTISDQMVIMRDRVTVDERSPTPGPHSALIHGARSRRQHRCGVSWPAQLQCPVSVVASHSQDHHHYHHN